jgi:hypothetical protein
VFRYSEVVIMQPRELVALRVLIAEVERVVRMTARCVAARDETAANQPGPSG